MIPINVLDGFVKAIKETGDFSDVRFIHAHKTSNAEKPVESFLVACGVGNVQMEKTSEGGSRHTAELEFHIYSPWTQGGRELGKMSARLMEALEGADTEGVLSSLKLSDGVYDADLCTMCQVLTAQVYSEVIPEEIPEADTVEIVVNGKSYEAASVEVCKEASVYEIRELLAGDTGEYLELGTRYTLKVRVGTSHDPLEDLPEADITVNGKVYAGCRVTEMTESISPDALCVRDYTMQTSELITEEGSD